MSLTPSDFREQVSIELIIGQNRDNPFTGEQKRSLAVAISTLCGGCTIVDSIGYWVEEAGNQRLCRFDTEHLQEEDTVHVLLTTEKTKFENVYNSLQRIIAVWKKNNTLDVEWIHCKVTPSFGAHFKV